ncbi:MAG: hypothetical protein LJE75_13540 [Gammaproteobacteria bacterium]|nr:hypothetical protein [Gammaproteobacteria bacterium]
MATGISHKSAASQEDPYADPVIDRPEMLHRGYLAEVGNDDKGHLVQQPDA